MKKNKLFYLFGCLLFLFSLSLYGCKRIDDAKNEILTSIKIEDIKTYSSNTLQNDLTFINKGQVKLNDNNEITVTNIEPKDKFTFNVKIKNDSIVEVNSQISILGVEKNDLFQDMEITLDGKNYHGMNAYTNWYTLKTDSTDKEKTISVTIEYPKEIIKNKSSHSFTIKIEHEAVLGSMNVDKLENSELGIKTVDDLTLFKDAVNNGHDFKNTTIKLLANINFDNKQFSPIVNKDNKLENVTFDGNNYTIKNLETIEGDNGGIISYNTSSLKINNLTLDNIKITTTPNKNQTYAGGIIGKNYAKVTFENVKINNSNIINNWQCGGFVGYSEKYAPTFKNCSIKDSFIGGNNATAGCFFGLGVVDITLENCDATNIKLYTDGLTWDSTQKSNNNFYVGHLYGQKLTTSSCSEKDINVVDKTS